MQDSPSTAAHRGRRVAEAGGALKLRHTYRVACMRARERARQSGAPAARIEQARRRAERAEQRCFAVWRTQEAAYRSSPSTPRPRAAQRQARPRQRRTGSSSTTSSADPPGEPPGDATSVQDGPRCAIPRPAPRPPAGPPIEPPITHVATTTWQQWEAEHQQRIDARPPPRDARRAVAVALDAEHIDRDTASARCPICVGVLAIRWRGELTELDCLDGCPSGDVERAAGVTS